MVHRVFVRGLPTPDKIFSFIKRIKGIFKNPSSVKVKWKTLTSVLSYSLPCESHINKKLNTWMKKHYTANNKKWDKIIPLKKTRLARQNCLLKEGTAGKGIFLCFGQNCPLNMFLSILFFIYHQILFY